MLCDIEFFESKLGKLDGCGDTAEYLTTIIKSKQVKTGRPANLAAAELDEDNADSSETGDKSEDKTEEEEKADDQIAAKAASYPETK